MFHVRPAVLLLYVAVRIRSRPRAPRRSTRTSRCSRTSTLRRSATSNSGSRHSMP